MARGRKRKLGARFPGGQLRPSAEELERRMTPRKPELVDPTPETQARRQAAFGDAKADGELCCPIDLLSKHLTAPQIRAGQYAKSTYSLYCAAIMAPRLVSGPWRDFVNGSFSGVTMDEDRAKKAVEAYGDMILAVRRYSFRSLKELERAMHGSMPKSIDSLASGLQALADHMGLEEKKAA